ncbi:hypothetical protein [Butyrivibrio sp. YAB3001]|uniref:hypothetical protein n=1 Tax=Butyrivibrio sp. YAB3001 TaxID=1520812 RepID=UPI0008F64277|nr:hypothetical protein [Butyrivibrio sp. YAB3001]SFC94154.1 hypothetical protein SAMN02910398_03570 [Butyrivibrio sp. YAB3001]
MSNSYKNVPDEMCVMIDNLPIEQPITGIVYRVSKSGIIDEGTFDNTYCEMLNGTTGLKKDLSEPGTYSTSVYLTPDSCFKFINFLAKKHRDKYPSPAVIFGEICYSDGRAQLTTERIQNYPEPVHVDWWIYTGKESEVAKRFNYYVAGE